MVHPKYDCCYTQKQDPLFWFRCRPRDLFFANPQFLTAQNATNKTPRPRVLHAGQNKGPLRREYLAQSSCRARNRGLASLCHSLLVVHKSKTLPGRSCNRNRLTEIYHVYCCKLPKQGQMKPKPLGVCSTCAAPATVHVQHVEARIVKSVYSIYIYRVLHICLCKYCRKSLEEVNLAKKSSCTKETGNLVLIWSFKTSRRAKNSLGQNCSSQNIQTVFNKPPILWIFHPHWPTNPKLPFSQRLRGLEAIDIAPLNCSAQYSAFTVLQKIWREITPFAVVERLLSYLSNRNRESLYVYEPPS